MEEYETVDEARRALARDSRAEAENALRTNLTRTAIVPKLRDLVQQRATAAGISRERAAEMFWDEVITAQHIRVVDSRYRLPELKGVLDSHEITIQSR